MHHSFTIRRLLLVALATTVVTAGLQNAPAAEQRWEYLPYRVRVFTAVAPECRFGPEFEKDLRRTLTAQAETLVGGAWNLQCEAAPADLGAEALANFDQITGTKLAQAAGAEQDKVFLLAVDVARAGYRVRVRELDVATLVLGETVERAARQPALVSQVAADALFAAFTPLAHVQMPREGDVVLRLRASRLLPNESSPAAAPALSLFRPYLPAEKAKGDEPAASVRPIPWTYIEVKGPAAGHLGGRLITGTGEALPATSRQERLAVMVKPSGKSTAVRLVATDENHNEQTLAGYELSERVTADGPLVRLGETNAQGILDIAANEHPLRDVYVTSGSAILARAPLAPGSLPAETLVLADDGPRREAEGFLRSFEGRMLDVLAQRTELVERAKRRLADGKRGEAEALAKQLRLLPTKDQLAATLDQGQRRIKIKPGPVGAQVEKMFKDTHEWLNFYLGKNPLDELPGLGRTP